MSDQFDIEYVTKLARIELTSEEKEALTREFPSILNYVDQLSALNTDQVQPMAHVIESVNVLRDDVVCQDLSIAQKVLEHAPFHDGHFFVVPSVIDA